MDAERPSREGIGALLEALRTERGFTKLSLADASGVSATYVAQIEGCIDTRTGREIRPSPATFRKLAEALGRGSPAEADRLYTRMMDTLGYLPSNRTAGGAGPETARVTLGDPRLHTHVRSVLESWEALCTEDQAAILTLCRLVDESRRRR